MTSATTSAQPTVYQRDVEVTLTSMVTAELIARGGVMPHNALCWQRRSGSVTEVPRWALTDALVALAEDDPTTEVEPTGVRAAGPRIYGDVTVALSSTVAAELIAQAGIVPGAAYCWRLPDGSQTTDPRTALTDALVVLAEFDPP